MEYPFKKPSIAVFENAFRTADNQPIKNVVVTLADGTKLEGGLWEATSKNGLAYLSGTLAPPSERQSYERQEPARSAKPEPEIDFG